MRGFNAAHDAGQERDDRKLRRLSPGAVEDTREGLLEQIRPGNLGWQPSGVQSGKHLQSQQVALGHELAIQRLGRRGGLNNQSVERMCQVHKGLTTRHDQCMRIRTATADSPGKIFMSCPRRDATGAHRDDALYEVIYPMDKQTGLAIVRHAYAKQVMAAAGIVDPRIEAAYAEVRREDFLGPGPWQMLKFPGGYCVTPDADPVLLYVDQLFGLVPERGVNNGQPSLHAALLAAAAIQDGEHVVHVGAGTGYYTAIMASLAGATGRVTAVEFDSGLAARARSNLASRSNVSVYEENGATLAFDTADVIYVNAGVTHPAPTWLDGLSPGGRLIIPLTTDYSSRAVQPGFNAAKAVRSGVYFRLQRRDADFTARGLLPVGIIPAEGARDPEAEAALEAALDKGGWNKVTRLIRGETVPDERCWLRGPGWCLACD